MIENEELPKITSIFLIVTRDCNLKCRYCYVDKEPKSISFKTAIDAVEFVARNSKDNGQKPSINFFGGEPLLKWNEIIVPVTLYIRRKYRENFKISITSNGLLIDGDKLEFMKKNDVKLLFSMDGNKVTQDLNRPTKGGDSSFDILINKIPLMLKYYPNLRFRSTLDNVNVKEFFNNHKFAVENGFKRIFTSINVFSYWTDDQMAQLKNEIDKLGDYFVYLLKNDMWISFQPFLDMFTRLKELEIAKYENSFRETNKNILGYGKCGLGAGKSASVGIDGKVYSCQEMVGSREEGNIFEIGNIYTGVDYNARINLINSFDPKKIRSSDGKMACKTCRLNRVCNSGCLINNYFVTGDINTMPSILCFYYNALLDKANEIKDYIK